MVDITRRFLLFLAFAAFGVLLPQAALSWHNTQAKDMWGGDGPALGGYDPVAYFTIGKATKGSEAFVHEWLGTEWHFASAEHRDLFAAEPTKYAPQHGGYCAVGVTGQGKFAADPEEWRIVDGKLYLFFSQKAASRFDPDSPKVSEANASWQNELLDMMHE